MTKQQRIDYLSNLSSTELTKSILYNGERNTFNVFAIDLHFLAYNPYNGRIMSLAKSFENQYGKLDPSNDKHTEIIENFIWESAPDYNKHTLESLRRFGQNEIGIVTKDGIIIDGNRRACLLNFLNREDSDNRKFLSIILPDELEDQQKEISKLETIYQIGVDDKVDYNPIEKYLKCAELLNYYTLTEVSQMMAESESKINVYLSILKLMEEYLIYLGYKGVYTRLYKKEGHFVDLNNYLNSYTKGSAKIYVDWNYTAADIEQMKKIYFDYIRLGYPVSQCRIIGRPTKSNSFFCFNSIWQEFSQEINKIKSDYIEPSLIKFHEENKGTDIEAVIEDKDRVWYNKVGERYILSLEYSSRILEDKKDSAAPTELLRRVKGTLGQIELKHITKENGIEISYLLNDIRQQLSLINNKLISFGIIAKDKPQSQA